MLYLCCTQIKKALKSESLFTIKENFEKVRLKGVEPPRLAAPDPKSGMSTNSITAAFSKF